LRFIPGKCRSRWHFYRLSLCTGEPVNDSGNCVHADLRRFFRSFIMVCRASTVLNDPALSPAERAARMQVYRLRSFYHHLAVYVAVNAGLLLINLLASPAKLWFYWPLLGWGIWVALHGLRTFSRDRWLGAEWEERKVRELMADKG
jgi:hypothetical protein